MMKGLRCPTADLERRQTSELHRITLMYDANGVTSISELGEFHRHSIVFDVWTSPFCDTDVLDNCVVAAESWLSSDPLESDTPAPAS